jgi:hypothetical protein
MNDRVLLLCTHRHASHDNDNPHNHNRSTATLRKHEEGIAPAEKMHAQDAPVKAAMLKSETYGDRRLALPVQGAQRITIDIEAT